MRKQQSTGQSRELSVNLTTAERTSQNLKATQHPVGCNPTNVFAYPKKSLHVISSLFSVIILIRQDFNFLGMAHS